MAKKPARTTRTPKRPSDPWAVFLRELARTANVKVACQKAVVGRTAAYAKRKDESEFAAAWDQAIEEAIEELEEVARQRAVEMSDTLLIFLLKAHRPEKYREIRESRMTGPQGGAIEANVNHGINDPDKALAPYADLVAKFLAGSGPPAAPPQVPPEPVGEAEAPPEAGAVPAP
jgi:hypothetical protein